MNPTKLLAAWDEVADLSEDEQRIWRVAYWLWPDNEQKRRDYFDMRIKHLKETESNDKRIHNLRTV